MIQEKIISVAEFDQLMKNGLKKSFEKSLRDLRRDKSTYKSILNEATKDKRATKIALTYEGAKLISSARLLCPKTGLCEINMVYTNPAYRGQGYAMKSVKKLTKKAKNKVFLIVKKNNTSAKKCYTKAGFVSTAEEGKYQKMVYKQQQTRKNIIN